MENAGFGKYSPDPDIIAEEVCSWLASPDTLQQLQNSALDAARPQATLDIAKDVAEILFEHTKAREPVKVGSR